jgi:lipopolysaccharide export system protein LptC
MPALLLVATSLLPALGCRAAKVSEAQPVVPELKLEGVRYRVYRGEELRTFGEAEAASLRRDSSELTARRLEATLPRGGAPLRISAPVGQGSLASRMFEVSGGVVATRSDDVARTERARYEPPGVELSAPTGAIGRQDGMVTGADPVALQGPGYRLVGTGFTLDPAAGTIVVGGGARLLAGLPRTAQEAP